jgi:hypothetical protein
MTKPRTTKAKPRSNQLLAQTVDGFLVGSNPVTAMKMLPAAIKAAPPAQDDAVCLSVTSGSLPVAGYVISCITPESLLSR